MRSLNYCANRWRDNTGFMVHIGLALALSHIRAHCKIIRQVLLRTSSTSPRCTLDMTECSSCSIWVHRACAKLTADEYNIFAADGVLYLFPHCIGRKSDGTYDQNVPKFAFCCWLLFFSIQNRLPICVLSSALLRLLWRLLCYTVLHMRSDGVISQTRSSHPDGFTTSLNSDKFIIREIFINKSNSIATDV